MEPVTQRILPPRRAPRAIRRWLVVALALLACAPGGIAPQHVIAAQPPARADAPTAGLPPVDLPAPKPRVEADAPSIQYEQAMEHEADVIPFQPGDRVTVPFKPRSRRRLAGRREGAARPPRRTRHRPPDARHAEGRDLGRRPAVRCRGRLGRGSGVGLERRAGVLRHLGHGGHRGGRAGQREGPAPRDLRIPAVLGGRRQHDDPRLADPLDGRLLQRRLHVVRRPREDQRGRDAVHRLGRLDELEDDLDHQRRPPQPDARRAHHLVLRLERQRGRPSGQPPRQRDGPVNLAKAAAAAVRDRGADGINLDFEPIVAGYADEFTALVRSVRSELNKVALGLPADLRHDGLHREPADRRGHRARWRRRGVHHGLRLPHGRLVRRRLAVAPDRPRYDLTDTVKAYTAKISPSKVILGVPYYGRAWSTASNAVNAPTLAPAKYGAPAAPTYVQAADLVAQHGRRYDSVEQAPWTAYQKQTCTATYGCNTSWRELYYDDAASLRLRYDLVNRTSLRGAGIWALGYDGTRPELARRSPTSSSRTRPPPLVGVTTLAQGQRDEGFRVGVELVGRQHDQGLRRPGLDRRRRVAGLADGHDPQQQHLPRERRPVVRVPGARDGHPRQRLGVEQRLADLGDRRAERDRGRRLRNRARRRPAPALGRHPPAHRS